MSWPKTDTIRAFAVYGTTLLIVLSSFKLLEAMIVIDPKTFGTAALGIIGATIAGATGFLFGQEQGKQQAVQTQAAFDKGLATPAPNGTPTVLATGTTTVEGGSPTTVTVTPAKPAKPAAAKPVKP